MQRGVSARRCVAEAAGSAVSLFGALAAGKANAGSPAGVVGAATSLRGGALFRSLDAGPFDSVFLRTRSLGWLPEIALRFAGTFCSTVRTEGVEAAFADHAEEPMQYVALAKLDRAGERNCGVETRHFQKKEKVQR